MILIITGVDNKKLAEEIGLGLLKQRLIVCYNLIPMQSAYRWKARIVKTKEFLLILKSVQKNFKEVEVYIQENSSYETPEVVAVKPVDVSKPYLNWVEKEAK